MSPQKSSVNHPWPQEILGIGFFSFSLSLLWLWLCLSLFIPFFLWSSLLLSACFLIDIRGVQCFQQVMQKIMIQNLNWFIYEYKPTRRRSRACLRIRERSWTSLWRREHLSVPWFKTALTSFLKMSLRAGSHTRTHLPAIKWPQEGCPHLSNQWP